MNQLLVTAILGPQARVDVAANGHEALAGRRRRYDLVRMDTQMPEMDGHEATRGFMIFGGIAATHADRCHDHRMPCSDDRRRCLKPA